MAHTDPTAASENREKRMRHKLVPLIVAPGALILLAGCNSSTKVTAPTTVPAPTKAPASASASPASTSTKLTIGEESSPYGKILEANGNTLYAFSIDTATSSKCASTACISIWPPLTPTSAPSYGSGVTTSLVGHLTRADGAQQITYAGHPLYYFAKDTAAGQTNGQDVNHFGGVWHVVSASTGAPVTTPPPTTTSTSTPPSTSSGSTANGY